MSRQNRRTPTISSHIVQINTGTPARPASCKNVHRFFLIWQNVCLVTEAKEWPPTRFRKNCTINEWARREERAVSIVNHSIFILLMIYVFWGIKYSLTSTTDNSALCPRTHNFHITFSMIISNLILMLDWLASCKDKGRNWLWADTWQISLVLTSTYWRTPKNP
jgi:hypothetical protein